MYDSLTLDQLRALATVAEAGSFSAAARRLKRVQSAVSTAIGNLEAELGVPLFDRSTKVPRLTEAGQAVLVAARRVLGEVDGLKRLTADLATGVEPAVALCLDAFFPLAALLELCRGFARAFPFVDLRIDTQVMSAVSERVASGAATLGVVSSAGLVPGLERRALSSIQMVPVVGRDHPLASLRGPISSHVFAEQTQIVLSERGDEGIADQAVLSPRTWRVADLTTKHAMLREGLGWGNLPEHLVREDLRAKRLVRIRPEAWAEREHALYLSAIYRPGTVFGPAHRWILSQLETLCRAAVKPPSRRGPSSAT